MSRALPHSHTQILILPRTCPDHLLSLVPFSRMLVLDSWVASEVVGKVIRTM